MLPLSYTYNGVTNNSNTVLAVRDDSTAKIRLDATFTRKSASYNPGTGVFSVPSVDVNFRRDVPDANGNPTGQRISLSLGARLPVMASDLELDAIIADFRAYVADPGFKDVILKQALPFPSV